MDKRLEEMFGKVANEPHENQHLPFPVVPTLLLQELERLFPNEVSFYTRIEPKDAAFCMGSMLGVQAVMSLLRQEHARQVNNPT